VNLMREFFAWTESLNFAGVPWDFWAILALLATLVPWRGVVRVRKLLEQPALTSAERLNLYGATIAAQWIGAGILAWRGWARGYLPADWGVGLPNPGAAFSATAVLLVLACGVQIISLRKLAQLSPERHGLIGQLMRKLMPQRAVESLVFATLALTAGICEEYFYRGFALTIIERASGGSAFAGIVASSALFALAHLYQGRRGLLATFVLGGIFGISRTLTGSLLPAAVAHAGVDLVAGLWAARKLRLSPQSSRS